MKGLNLIKKEYLVYYIGSILVLGLVILTKGYSQAFDYFVVLFCLFLPTVITIQIFVFIRQILVSEKFKIKEVISFLLVVGLLVLSFKELSEKQKVFLTTINAFILTMTVFALMYFTSKNNKN